MSLPTKPGYYYWRQPGTICPFGQPESRIVWFHPDEPATHVATGEWGPRIPEREQLEAMRELADADADEAEATEECMACRGNDKERARALIIAQDRHRIALNAYKTLRAQEPREVLPAPRLAATYLDALVEKVRKA